MQWKTGYLASLPLCHRSLSSGTTAYRYVIVIAVYTHYGNSVSHVIDRNDDMARHFRVQIIDVSP